MSIVILLTFMYYTRVFIPTKDTSLIQIAVQFTPPFQQYICSRLVCASKPWEIPVAICKNVKSQRIDKTCSRQHEINAANNQTTNNVHLNNMPGTSPLIMCTLLFVACTVQNLHHKDYPDKKKFIRNKKKK